MTRALPIALLLASCIPRVDRGPAAVVEARKPVTLIEQPDADSPSIYLSAMVAAGSAHDPSGREGLADLTARSMVGSDTIREALYPTGNTLSVVVDRDWVTLRLRCHADHAAVCLDVFAGALTAPTLDVGTIERVRAQAAHHLQTGLVGDTEGLGHEALASWLYEAHPYGHPTRGRYGVLDQLTPERARRFHTDYFVRENVVAGIAGNYSSEHVATLQTRLEALPGDRAPELPLQQPVPARGRSLLVLESDTPVTGIHIGHTLDVTRTHPDWAALLLATQVLGQHRQSTGRLYQRMRTERGLNYGDYAYIEPFVSRGWSRFQEQGTVRAQPYFYIWIRPVSLDNGPFATRMAIAELTDWVASGITDDELQLAREHLTNNLQLWAQDPGQRLAYALEATATGLPNPLDTLADRLAPLTVEQVATAIGAHIDPDNLRIVAVSGDASGLRDKLIEETPTPIVYADVVPTDAQAARDQVIAATSLGIAESWVVPAEGFFR
jgi:zinc protease